jgi:hypothetical protein
MHSSIRLAALVAALVVGSAHAQGRSQVPIAKAGEHVGEDVTVCGPVDSARQAKNSEGEPTFLHMGGAFPRHLFSARIWGADLPKFSLDVDSVAGKTACISGKVEVANNRPEIVVTQPSLLAIF